MKHIELGRGLPAGMACMAVAMAMALSPRVAAQQATPAPAAAAVHQAEVMVPPANHVDWTHLATQPRSKVPDLTHKTVQEASSLLANPNVNLVLKVTGNQDSDATPGTILSQTPAAATEVPSGSEVDVTVAQAASAPAQQLMPRLIGVPVVQAVVTLRQMELPLGTPDLEYSDQYAAGVISAQDPAEGTPILRGDRFPRIVVKLGISKGPPPAAPPPANPVPSPPANEVPTVPDLGGMTRQDAEVALRGVGLRLGATAFDYSSSVRSGLILSQAPAAGTRINPNAQDTVSAVLSRGAAPPQAPPVKPVPSPPVNEVRTVPDLGLMTQAQAEAALRDAGLQLGAIAFDYSGSVRSGLVLSQAPAAGTRIDRDVQAVSAVLSQGPAPPPRWLWPTIGVGLALLAALAWMIRKWLRPKLPVRISAGGHRAPAAVTIHQSGQRPTPDVRLRTRLLPGEFRLVREPQYSVSGDAAAGDNPGNQA